MKLDKRFYLRDDVVEIACDLLGKTLITNYNGQLTSGLITETEAYAGKGDKASHAYGGRKTKRTEIMFRQGGIAYIYLCYGIHSLFNIVTNKENIPHAILIRGILPVDGKDIMMKRTRKATIDKNFGVGPGKVSKALGIHFSDSGRDLTGERIWVEDRGIIIENNSILITSRIGIDYAEEDAKLPYRFVIKDPERYI